MKPIRILGHPSHPPLTHFPMALLPLSFLLDLGGLALGHPELWKAAYWSLCLGLLAAVPAALAGFLDFLSIPEGHGAERDAQIHLWTMGTALVLFTMAWLGTLGLAPGAVPGWGPIACSGAGTFLMGAGGWFGGRLVYHHGIGRE